jgi:bifunctional UDP-N-acetylglucosamine pyrophosphorylase/glucosamine-1-phosphate N-acetyltransferase
MNKSVVAVIMAGGLGKRMESNIPKVLHKIGRLEMINHVLLKLNVLRKIVYLEKVLIIVGQFKEQIKEAVEECKFKMDIIYVNQPNPLGTGHAMQCCREELLRSPNSEVLILSGDVPFLSSITMLNLLKMPDYVKIITTNTPNPDGYGRVIKSNNIFEKIVEHKDCNVDELNINTVNCGIYSIHSKLLCKYLPYLKNDNSQNEYYLTDIIEIIKREEGVLVGILEVKPENKIEITGVNTIAQLKELEELFKKGFN